MRNGLSEPRDDFIGTRVGHAVILLLMPPRLCYTSFNVWKR